MTAGPPLARPLRAPETTRGALLRDEGEAPGVVVAVDPTQARHPWRATVRTVFAAVVSLAAMLPLIVNASGVDETAPPIAGALAIAGAVTRIMALPAVETFLRRFVPWLAAAPSAYIDR